MYLMRHLPWYLLWHFLRDPVALFVGNIDADFVGNLAGHLVWHFYALLLWNLPALLLRHLEKFDEQFSIVQIESQKQFHLDRYFMAVSVWHVMAVFVWHLNVFVKAIFQTNSLSPSQGVGLGHHGSVLEDKLHSVCGSRT